MEIFIVLQLCYIGFWDWKTKKISNKAAGLLLILILLNNILTQTSIDRDHAAGILIVSIPMLFLTVIWPGSFGGGDIKLMAVCGLWMGCRGVVRAFVYAVFAAAIYALYLLIKEKGRKAEFALGPFLCLGIMLCFLEIF